MTSSPHRTLVLRPRAVATELGIGIATFWRLVAAGKIKTVKISPRCTGVLRTELEAYLTKK